MLPTQARPGSIGSVPDESTACGPLAAAVGAATTPASSSTTSGRLMPPVHPSSCARSREMSIRAVATVNGVTTGHPGQALRRGALLRLRVRSWPILQTAGAAVAAWYLATLLVSEEQPVFAAIAAVVSLGATYGQRPERAVELVGGVVLGIGLADLLVGAIGSGPLQLGLLVMLAMGAAVLLGGGPLLVTEAAVSATLLVLLEPSSTALPSSRLIEALAGGGVALAVSALAFPPNPAPREASSSATPARRGTSPSPSATVASSPATRRGSCAAAGRRLPRCPRPFASSVRQCGCWPPISTARRCTLARFGSRLPGRPSGRRRASRSTASSPSPRSWGRCARPRSTWCVRRRPRTRRTATSRRRRPRSSSWPLRVWPEPLRLCPEISCAPVNAFHVIGALFALWAVILAVVGVTRDDFPRPGFPTLAVGMVSVLLAAGAIGSGIITSALEDEEEGEEAGQAEAAEGGAGALSLTADAGGQLSFDKKSLEAPAGEVTIRMENPSSVPHNISVEGDGVDEEGETVEKGGTSEVSANLRAGEYTFYCSVPGHREGGMEGTLT